MRDSNRRWLLTVCVFCVIAAAWCSSFEYSVKRSLFDPIQFRVKRDIELIDGEEPKENEWNLPQDYEVENDTADHEYYTLTGSYGSDAEVKKNWVDLAKMLTTKNTTGNDKHPHLSHGYRRAVGVKLSFDFPFYGYPLKNITIATGGFLYLGDQTHNWLAATQYIAPLMANFDTTPADSNIIYADDGEKFVVEYRKVKLRDQDDRGAFTFQVILHKNGDIIFIYKDFPMLVADISQSHHPVKMGISDAYLFKHNTSFSGQVVPKRVIYEYHRVEMPAEKIVNNTVITLTAMPTCLSLSSCSGCASADLKHFKCTWCSAGDSNSFCTDDAGLHRRRQEWVDHNCKLQGDVKTVCPATDMTASSGSSSSAYSNGSSPDIVPLDKKSKEAAAASKQAEKGGSGYAMLVIFLASCVVVVGWIAYAYYNPHTTSGQLLIKYRPSKWKTPHSHVRYSASVHM